mgnify:CR=1 FL=1
MTVPLDLLVALGFRIYAPEMHQDGGATMLAGLEEFREHLGGELTVTLLRDIGHLVLYQTVPQRAQSALIESANLNTPLAEVEQSSIGCDYAEVGAELIRFWGMPVQIEQAIRHQLTPNLAGEYALHASIVHLAGVIADHHESTNPQAPHTLPFNPYAIQTTQFKDNTWLPLLKEAEAQLEETLALFSPMAMAA